MDSTSNSRSLSFVALSTGMHIFLAAGLAAITIQMPPTDRTEIEILEQPKSVAAEIESPLPQLHAPAAKAQPTKAAPVIASADVVAAEIEKSLESSTTAVQAPALKVAHLDSALIADASQVETTDVENDVENLDVDDSYLTAAAAKDLDQKTNEDLQQKEALTAAMIAAQKTESEKAAKEDAKIRAAERKALADKIAAEETARQQAVNEQANGTAPVAMGVRALEDLRQIPGNKRPKYDNDDRLYQRQGQVSFAAYVSKEGRLTSFKMIKSSGHRELDKKTLQTLKEWKFYPGQEGWVEIPFSWDLVGGPKEMPTTLRRSGSNL